MTLYRIVLFSNTAWYLYNHRLTLAQAVRDAGMEAVLVSPYDPYVDKIRGEGFEWHEMNLSRRGMNPFAELGSLLRIRRLYRQLQPDLVHHFTIKPVLYGSIAARFAGSPALVNSITGQGYLFVNESVQARVLRQLVRPLYRFAFHQPRARAVFQNEADQGSYLSRGVVTREQAALIPGSGVDLERFCIQPEPGGRPVVMLASRLLWDKGIAEFVKAARLLKAKGVEADFVLVGVPDPGNPASICDSDLQGWEREGLLKAWGQRDDMQQVLASCHVFAFPSFYGEGLPKVLLEAAAVGRPVIAADVPGSRDALVDGETGMLVPPRDVEALADAVQRLLKDRALRLLMGQAGRQFIEDHHSAGAINSRYLELYRSLIQ